MYSRHPPPRAIVYRILQSLCVYVLQFPVIEPTLPSTNSVVIITHYAYLLLTIFRRCTFQTRIDLRIGIFALHVLYNIIAVVFILKSSFILQITITGFCCILPVRPFIAQMQPKSNIYSVFSIAADSDRFILMYAFHTPIHRRWKLHRIIVFRNYMYFNCWYIYK